MLLCHLCTKKKHKNERTDGRTEDKVICRGPFATKKSTEKENKYERSYIIEYFLKQSVRSSKISLLSNLQSWWRAKKWIINPKSIIIITLCKQIVNNVAIENPHLCASFGREAISTWRLFCLSVRQFVSQQIHPFFHFLIYK